MVRQLVYLVSIIFYISICTSCGPELDLIIHDCKEVYVEEKALKPGDHVKSNMILNLKGDQSYLRYGFADNDESYLKLTQGSLTYKQLTTGMTPDVRFVKNYLNFLSDTLTLPEERIGAVYRNNSLLKFPVDRQVILDPIVEIVAKENLEDIKLSVRNLETGVIVYEEASDNFIKVEIPDLEEGEYQIELVVNSKRSKMTFYKYKKSSYIARVSEYLDGQNASPSIKAYFINSLNNPS